MNYAPQSRTQQVKKTCHFISENSFYSTSFDALQGQHAQSWSTWGTSNWGWTQTVPFLPKSRAEIYPWESCPSLSKKRNTFLPLEMELSRDESSQRSLLTDALAFSTDACNTQRPTEFLHGLQLSSQILLSLHWTSFLCLVKNYEFHHPTFKSSTKSHGSQFFGLHFFSLKILILCINVSDKPCILLLPISSEFCQFNRKHETGDRYVIVLLSQPHTGATSPLFRYVKIRKYAPQSK